MQIGCAKAYACVFSYYEAAKKSLGLTIFTLNEIRHSPEAFQKSCLIGLAALRAVNFHCHTNYFSRFISVLDSAPAFDLYACCRLPRYFLHPYSVERLDEYHILDQLEVILCDNWHLGLPDKQGKNRASHVRQYAKDQLNAFLKKMLKDELDFASEKEVKTILHNWFKKTLESNPKEGFSPHHLNFEGLKIELKPISWLESSIIYSFAFADIACVPDFFQTWGLVDLAPYANRIGQVSFLDWVPNQVLDQWVWGALSVGFLLQFINAFHALKGGELSSGEEKDAKWIIVASIAECVYCSSNLVLKDHKWINCLALIAKSLGLIAFLNASKPTFFIGEENEKDAFAVL